METPNGCIVPDPEKAKLFDIKILATISSTLSREELESMLVVALADIESNITFVDGANDKFQVMDYLETLAKETKSTDPFSFD